MYDEQFVREKSAISVCNRLCLYLTYVTFCVCVCLCVCVYAFVRVRLLVFVCAVVSLCGVAIVPRCHSTLAPLVL